jgi:hypothetical protein
MLRRNLISLALCAVALAGCRWDGKEDDLSVEKVEGITRVMMHQPHEYTFFVPKPNSAELTLVHAALPSEAQGVMRIMEDVKGDGLPWALIKRQRDIDKWTRVIEIHIRGVEDIEGGGWSRRVGKSTPRGQTTVLDTK